MLWSFVGFGLFYAPLSFAAAYGPGWLIAGTWQITIIAGSLLVPFFGQRIPYKGLAMSVLILAGVAIMQLHEAKMLGAAEVLYGIVPVVIGAFAYPLGNRKMMALTSGRIEAYQRVLGMTLASLPFWLVLAGFGVTTAECPAWVNWRSRCSSRSHRELSRPCCSFRLQIWSRAIRFSWPR